MFMISSLGAMNPSDLASTEIEDDFYQYCLALPPLFPGIESDLSYLPQEAEIKTVLIPEGEALFIPYNPPSQKSCSEYMCECGKTFQHLSKLKEHKKVHTDDRPHKCSACNSRFKRHTDLRMHNYFCHVIKEGNFKCPQCPRKKFCSRTKFTKHLKKHEGPFSCLSCSKKCNGLASFLLHNSFYHPNA